MLTDERKRYIAAVAVGPLPDQCTVWATAFCAVHPEVDQDEMNQWFASAMTQATRSAMEKAYSRRGR